MVRFRFIIDQSASDPLRAGCHPVPNADQDWMTTQQKPAVQDYVGAFGHRCDFQFRNCRRSCVSDVH